MADLVSMRAEAAEARQKIDTILGIDGELSTNQVAELEQADNDFKRISEEVRKAEVLDSARQSLAAPTYEFRGGVEKALENRNRPEPETRSYEAMLDDAGQRLLYKLGKIDRLDIRTADPYDTTDISSLIPVDLKNELVRRLPKMSAVMEAATVGSSDHDNEIAAVVNRIPTATIVDEAAAFTVAQGTFSRIRFRAYKYALETQITLEALQDNRPAAMEETLQQHMESYAEGIDASCLATMNPADASRTGPGGLCATGLNINAAGATNINDVTTGSGDLAVADLAIEDFLATQAAVPGRYRSGDKAWIMSPDVHAQIVQTVTADDRLIFFPQSTGTLQSDPLSVGTLLGSPIYLSDAMPSPGADAVAALYLDRRSYRIELRKTMQTQQDPFTNGGSGIVTYRSHMRADGQWTLAEASSRLLYASS